MPDRSGQLTETEQREIQRLREELGTEFCQRCDYCQPCPEEIAISTVMSNDSLVKRLPPEEFFSAGIIEAMEKAANCIECGECEARCPFRLPIRDRLAERVKWYREELKKYQKHVAT